MDERLTIGDLANATGTKVVTVRYYEQAGCRDLGFTLDQVRDLLRLSAQENQPSIGVNRISAEHLTEIDQVLGTDPTGRRAAPDQRPL